MNDGPKDGAANSNHVSTEELERALAFVLDAPATDTRVAILCRRPAYNKREFPERLTLSREHGIDGDFEMGRPWLKLPDGRPDPRIQVSILPSRVLDLVWRDRDTTLHPGDAIVADLNTSLDALPTGACLKIGTAVVQVSDIWNDGCAKWRVRYGRAAQDWVSHPDHERMRLRGILCSIEQDGEVALGDRICRL